MTPKALFTSLQPFMVGLGLPLAVAAAGITLPIQFGQSASIGEIKAKVDQLRTDVDKLTTGIDTLNKHLADRDTDPNKLLAQMLGASDDWRAVSVVLLDGGLIAFPRTEAIRKKFVDAGYPSKVVTPTISGFSISLAKASVDRAPGQP